MRMNRKGKTETPASPQHLSDRSKELWNEIVGEQVRGTGALIYFQTALEALDRAEEARTQIKAEGTTTKTARSGVVHVHPLVKVERESRQLFARLWDNLWLHRSIT